MKTKDELDVVTTPEGTVGTRIRSLADIDDGFGEVNLISARGVQDDVLLQSKQFRRPVVDPANRGQIDRRIDGAGDRHQDQDERHQRRQ